MEEGISIISYLVTCLYEVIFPHINVCACCGERSDNIICNKCIKDIYIINRPIKLTDYNEDVYPCSYYSKNMRKLIYKYKYGKDYYISDYFAMLISEKIRDMDLDVDDYILTYIPISKSNMKKRSFDQCKLICNKVSKIVGMKSEQVLKKKDNVKEQKTLLHEERLLNLKDSFYVCKDVLGKKIIIIDDVITTGSTLFYAKKSLMEKGAIKVLLISVAKSTI